MAAQRTAVAESHGTAPVSAFEKAIIFGDVTGLSERDRLDYLKQLAASVGLDPISRPFGYLPAGGKLTVYLTATGAAQLRRIHNVSVTDIVDEGIVDGFYRIKVYGKMPSGRVDVEYGSVSVLYPSGDMHKPQDLENDRKKTLTQAKTRLTKSMVGLAGVLAEEEIDDLTEGQQEQPRQLASVHQIPASTDQPQLTRADLEAKAAQLAILTGEDVTVPEKMTRKEAYALDEFINGLIAQAEHLPPMDDTDLTETPL